VSDWDALPWITIPVLVPLLAAPCAFLLERRALPWLPLLVSLGIIAGLIGLTAEILQHGPQRYAIGGWSAPLGIDLYADGFSVLLLWLTAAVGVLVSLYALAYFRQKPAQSRYFWPLWLLLWMALAALFLAADIFNLYVTLELLTLAAVALTALAGGTAALTAALRYLIFALLGSLAYLLGVALLYGSLGTLDIAQIGQAIEPGARTWMAVALITLGLLTKAAIFPLHVWLPPAHASAPAPVSALLSALVAKAACYLLLRLWLWAFPGVLTPAAGQLLGLLGACAIFYGSAQALIQRRLKLLVAYSTVAQLGYLLLLFPLLGALAWNGAVLHMIAHGLAKAALFLAAGNVLYALGHDRIMEFSGLSVRLQLTLLAFAVAGVSIMGLPPSSGFLAKWLLLQAALESGQWWWLLTIIIGGLLAAGYIARVVGVAVRNEADMPASDARLPWTLALTPLLLALLSLGLGLAGMPLLALLAVGAPFPAEPAFVR